MTDDAERILEVLQGNLGPINAGELQAFTGIPTRAQIRRAVHELRLSGYTVCSRTADGGGYWLGDQKDRWETILSLKSRVREMQKVIQALERGPLDGQEVMDGVQIVER